MQYICLLTATSTKLQKDILYESHTRQQSPLSTAAGGGAVIAATLEVLKHPGMHA
jgi:hypothetical protein